MTLSRSRPSSMPLVLFAAMLAAGGARAQVPATRPLNAHPPTATPVLRGPVAALAAIPPMNLAAVADSIEARLNGRVVGYAFAVSYRDQVMVTRAGGVARRAPDLRPRAMTPDERFNVASVSKTITAAALMQLLPAGPGRGQPSVDLRIAPLLPQDWTFGPHMQEATLRQLLTHRSGLRCATDVSYAGLRQCVAAGAADSVWKVWGYNNENFALLRLVIARLGARRTPLLATDGARAAFTSGQYVAYVRTHVLEPAGITNAQCHPITGAPGLAYQNPAPVQAGTDFGPMDLRCGSQGWNLSVREMGRFMGTLLYTPKILPPGVTTRMRDEGLGLYTGELVPGIWETGHGGFYPGKDVNGAIWNPGEISTVIVGLSNGVSVAAIVNSQIDDGQGNFNARLDDIVKNGLRKALPK